MTKQITRSSVNEQQYSAPQFPTSGFPLSYRRYSSAMLGRLHVGGFHFVMPGDKISGQTRGECTMHRIVTPIVSPINAMQYNIFLPLRPLDRSFMKGITPTKLNAMSANWTMPLFNTRYLVNQVLRALYDIAYNGTIPSGAWAHPLNTITEVLFPLATSNTTLAQQVAIAVGDNDLPAGTTVSDILYGKPGFAYPPIVKTVIDSLTTTGSKICNMADNLYLRDALLDIAENITAKLGSIENPISGNILIEDFLQDLLSCFLEPFVGRYSYYGEFKYEFVRPFDIYRMSHNLVNVPADYTSFINCFSDTPQNEYAIRAMYAIWYERFRNVDLEPVSPTLPDWQEWSSTSIFDMANGGNLLYLLYRIRPWEDDMFISSQIDDMSRHVFAPVFGELVDTGENGYPVIGQDTARVAYHDDAFNNQDGGSNNTGNNNWLNQKPATYLLTYRDQLSDSNKSIACPVPTNINDVLSSLDISFKTVYGLDLNTLRQSQMLERYLKRNYLFGDEYQDRMLAHYNSRVSDMRINKPEILSRSLDGYDMQQEVSNVSTSETKVGDRTATATIKVNGEPFTTFAEEFGIIVSIVCFMPRAMYDGTCPQHYMSKQIHLPLPEFAANNEEFGRKSEIAGTGLAPIGNSAADDNRYIFGRYPAYHAWRSRVDEVGGEFLDEMQECTFRRFFGMYSDDTTPKLNYFFIHCRPNLGMFADTVRYDTQLYFDLVHECYVERVLPTPVEVI